MEQPTYDPVLDDRALPRMRLLNPLRPPEPGVALVLVPNTGYAVTVRHGEAVPAARLGTYQRVLTVDTSEHPLVLTIDLLSRDPAFAFRSRVGLICRVADPAEVVVRGIRDMSATLYEHLKRRLRSVSREYDIAEFHEAEDALNAAVRSFAGDSAIHLRNLNVELLVDEDEVVGAGRAFRDVERETRLSGMKRRRHLEMLRTEGPEGLIAEIMEREGPRGAWELISQAEGEERRQLQEAMSLLFGRDDIEPMELEGARSALMDRVLGGSDAPFGGTRRGRLRGSMSAKSPRELAAGEEDRRGSMGPGSSARGPTVRGEVVAGPADSPPEDEPLTEPSSGLPAQDLSAHRPAASPDRERPSPRRDGGTGGRVSRVRGTRRDGGGGG